MKSDGDLSSDYRIGYRGESCECSVMVDVVDLNEVRKQKIMDAVGINYSYTRTTYEDEPDVYEIYIEQCGVGITLEMPLETVQAFAKDFTEMQEDSYWEQLEDYLASLSDTLKDTP